MDSLTRWVVALDVDDAWYEYPKHESLERAQEERRKLSNLDWKFYELPAPKLVEGGETGGR